MSQINGRDWTKERWRKQYVREPLQHRAWPVMARGLRELLNALAEDDGTLVRHVDDPAQALLRGLNPQEYELELLLREGVLARDEHSMWIPDLPRAQAQRDATTPPSERTTAPADGRQTSTQRVRDFRARQRERNATGVFDAPVSAPAGDVALGEGGVSETVSPFHRTFHPRAATVISIHQKALKSKERIKK